MKQSKFAPGQLSATLYPVVLIVSGMLFYLAATGRTGWYFYVLLSFLVVERAIIAFVQWVAKIMIAKVVETAMAQMLASQNLPSDPTLGPIHGGKIDPPESMEPPDAEQ